MHRSLENKIGIRLIQFYIFTIFTYGFWVNYLHFTLIIDFAMILCFAYVILKQRGKIQYDSTHKLLISLSALFVLGTIMIAILKCYIVKMSILGARSYIAYMLMALMVYNINLSKEQYSSILNTIEGWGTVSALFGIIQFFFHSFMPDKLLHMGSSGIAYVFGLGTPIFRVNGLFENTIVYGGVLSVDVALIIARMINKEIGIIHLVPFIIAVIALGLTFSRAAIVGSLLIIIFEELFNQNKTIGIRIITIISIAVAIIIIIAIFFSNTPFIHNLLGNTSSAQTSNQQHSDAFLAAKSSLSKHWLLGVGMGTQGYESTGSSLKVITDGGWYTFFLELGVPLTILFVGILLGFFYVMISKMEQIHQIKKGCTIAAISIIAYFFATSFLNSSFLARENMALCWLLIALALYNFDDNVVYGEIQ